MLVLSSVLLTDHTRVSYYQLGTVNMLAKIKEGDVCLPLLFPESGKASVFSGPAALLSLWVKQRTSKSNQQKQQQQQPNFVLYAAST